MTAWTAALALALLTGCAGAAQNALNTPGGPMSQTFEAHHVSVSIARSPEAVYRFASVIERWPEWAHGIGKSVRPDGQNCDWIATGPLGDVRVRFAEQNSYRVLDHDVTLADGRTFNNAFRVIPNGEGSEVVFSVFRQPGASDQAFREDCQAVEKDLYTLKELIEGS
jgi:hypothetical protein